MTPALSHEQELCLLFTQAIAMPGRPAKYLDRHNQAVGFASIEDAVSSNQAFCIDQREGITVADLDDEEDHTWAGRARGPLEAAGCRIVLTASGTPSHSHMWIIAPPGWDNEYTKDRLYDAGGTGYLARRGRGQGRTAGIRPPYAPHRNPEYARSSLIEPGLLEALAAFGTARRRDLSPRYRDMLQRFDPSTASRGHKRPSRSLTLAHVALAAVNARWTFEEFAAALRDPTNETARLYFEDYPHKLHNGWIDGVWRRAMKRAREHPSRPSSEVARETIDGLLTCMNNLEWPSRTAANDRAVYRALLGVASKAGSTSVGASVRRLSVLSGVPRNGVTRALKRLGERGLIRRLGTAAELTASRRSGRADTYALSLDHLPARVPIQGRDSGGSIGGPSGTSGPAVQSDEVEAESVVLGDTKGLFIGDRGYVVSRSTSLLLRDLFTNGGLGLSCRETWEALPLTPTKTGVVAALRPGDLKPATVREHLKALHVHGLAGRRGHRWWRLLPPDESLHFSLDHLGVRNKTASRQSKYEHETTTYQRHQARYGFQPPEKKDKGTAA